MTEIEQKALALVDAKLYGMGVLKNGKHVPIEDVYLDPRDALIETQAREIERLRGALKTAEAWLDRWARHIGDCPGIDDCTCGLTRVRYEAETTLASIEGNDHG